MIFIVCLMMHLVWKKLKKSQMFSQIQEKLKRLTLENRMEVIIVIDEAQFLRKEILREILLCL